GRVHANEDRPQPLTEALAVRAQRRGDLLNGRRRVERGDLGHLLDQRRHLLLAARAHHGLEPEEGLLWAHRESDLSAVPIPWLLAALDQGEPLAAGGRVERRDGGHG